MAESAIYVHERSELQGTGCPSCRYGIEEGQHVVKCPRCHTVHHEDCWYHVGGCGTRGCSGVSSDPPERVASYLAASRARGGTFRPQPGKRGGVVIEETVRGNETGVMVLTFIVGIATVAFLWVKGGGIGGFLGGN
ncbi:MAG TPA: RING finger protein [Limnochordia bacterium]|nr:RING finger protein [Limnochordia bacterium]